MLHLHPNKTQLNAAILKAKAVDETLYTKETLETLANELEYAEEISGKKDATCDEVQLASALLEGALDGLKTA